LIHSIPVLGEIKKRLDVIEGVVPNLIDLPPGCSFAPRCEARLKHNLDICTLTAPELKAVDPGHTVQCWLYHDHVNHNAPFSSKSS
jgi:oligopeptide/dipeptide ABC transporter ATP-binding protein